MPEQDERDIEEPIDKGDHGYELPTPSDDALSKVAALAERRSQLDAQIAAAERHLKRLQADLKQVAQVELPEAMLACHLRSFILEDGREIEIVKIIKTGIPKETEEEAFRWLRANNFGDIIKRTVATQFGMGDDKDANALAAELRERGLAVVDRTAVHPSTLKAFVKEQIDHGVEFPTAIWIEQGREARIKTAKKESL